MLVWTITIVLIAFAGIPSLANQKQKRRFLWSVAIILIFIMGSRNATASYGSDINNYYRLYQQAIELDWDGLIRISTMEKGYLAINFILSKIIQWPQFILYAQAAFCVITSLWFVRKNTDNVYLGTMFFVCFGSFQFFLTGFRQAIAICICQIAFVAAKDKKLLKYVLLLFIAISIHQTAIVFLPMYFILNMKESKSRTAIVTIAMIVISSFASNLIEVGNEVFDKNYSAFYGGNLLGGIVQILIYIVAFLLPLFFKLKQEKIDNNTSLLRTSIIGCGIYCMRYIALPLERISFYFTPSMPVLLADEIKNMSNECNRRVISFVALFASMLLFLWRVNSQIGPYVFFWE